MLEIELSVFVKQCLSCWLLDIKTLRTQVAAWERRRNAAHVTVYWQFGLDAACSKLARLDVTQLG